MPITISQTTFALGPLAPASFAANGGTAPYTYSVEVGGAGGSINAATGVYTGPTSYSLDPSKRYDTITVTDDVDETAQSQILVGSPLMLLCDIVRREMNLAEGRVYLWDQKLMMPTDHGLFIAISETSFKPFANVNRPTVSGSNLDEGQYVVGVSQIDFDIISRGPEAREYKEFVMMALKSTYSERQQELNGFKVSSLPSQFINLSQMDGSAIPYRYKATVGLTHCKTKTKAIDYFDDFSEVKILTDP